MASVFKLGRNKRKKNSPWYFEYKDENGKKRMMKGFTDKALTEQLAVKMETEVRLRTMGLVDPEQDRRKERRESPIAQQLTSFETHLERKKNSAKHISLTMGRIRRIVDGCEFEALGDLNAEEVEEFMGEIMEEDDLGHRTYNHYLQAMESFCNFLVPKQLESNPISGIERLNAEVDVRHPRRALKPKEFAKLVETARQSKKVVRQYSGEQRSRVYIASYMTGLRKGELASLTPTSFALNAKQPTVTIQASASKHRRKDVLPLHPEFVAMLRQWMKGLEANEPLFPDLANRRTSIMVKKDLEAAGIPYRTATGIADFHAAGRHTHITELLRNGASVVEAKELARHSDIRMTMKYVHIGIEDQAKALKSLPAPCQDIVRKRRVFDGPSESSDDTDCREDGAGPKCETACKTSGFDTDQQQMSPHGSKDQKRRARDSGCVLS